MTKSQRSAASTPRPADASRDRRHQSSRARSPHHLSNISAAPNLAPIDYRKPGDSLGERYQTSLEAVAILQEGLPFKALLRLAAVSGLTLERIKQITQISEGSFSRRKQDGRFSAEESERVLRLARVFEHATALHDGDQAAAREWLETSIPSLANHRPLDLARTEPGAREVEDLIGRIEHGIVS